jgi:hypothetical protein
MEVVQPAGDRRARRGLGEEIRRKEGLQIDEYAADGVRKQICTQQATGVYGRAEGLANAAARGKSRGARRGGGPLVADPSPWSYASLFDDVVVVSCVGNKGSKGICSAS